MMMPVADRRRSARAARGLGVALLLVVAGCGGDAAAPDPSPEGQRALELTFDDLQSPVNGGAADVSVEVVALGGGRLRAAEGPDGDPAARFPAYSADAAEPVAVVVRPAPTEDALSPGEAAFTFGVDVRIDRESQGSAVDDGNNVVQRGLYDGPQYKIQVDRGVASCRVAGSTGSAFVEEQQPLPVEEWYRIECSRDGDELTLRTMPLERDQEAAVTTARGPIGAVILEGAGAPPLTIGCKVDGAGNPVASSTDQLNGAVDNVFLDLAG